MNPPLLFLSLRPYIEDKHYVLATTFLEGVGASLFVLGFALGAKMLMLFLLVVTPVMHPARRRCRLNTSGTSG